MSRIFALARSTNAVAVYWIMYWILLAVMLISSHGCGTTAQVCYIHPKYGQVCVEYNGHLHIRVDLAGDAVKVDEIKEWLKLQGVEIK